MTLVNHCCIFVLVINNNTQTHTIMTTFNDIKAIANRASQIGRTPATDKQCAFLASLINEKLNGDYFQAFGVNVGNMALTSKQASEMISDLLEIEAQAQQTEQIEATSGVFVGVNENGEYLDFYGEVTEKEFAHEYDKSEIEDAPRLMLRDNGVVMTIVTI